MTGRRSTPRRAAGPATVAFCLFALLFSVYLLTFSGIYHSSDEMSMLAATDSLARRGAWDIDLLRWMGEQQGSFGPDGHLYSRKGIGTSLAALPLYWLALQSGRLGNVQSAMLTNGLVTALTAAFLFLLVFRLGYKRGVALGTALAFGLGTMAWPYARYLFSETLAALGLVASAYALASLSTSDTQSLPPNGGLRSTRLWVSGSFSLLAGTGLAVALLARLNNAIVAPFFGMLLLTLLHRRYRFHWRSWIAPLLFFALPILAALAVSAWYNALRFGSPWTTGYLPEERFATPFFQGLYGLTFSPGKGLFWYNPLLFAALVAWPALFRRHREVAVLAVAVVLINVAFYAPWYLWWAGHSWGPRFLVVALPFAVLPLAPALEAASRRRPVALTLGLLAVAGLAIQTLGTAVDFNLYLEDIYAELGLYHPDTLFRPAYSPLVRQWAYLRGGTLDLAWARGGQLDGQALVAGLGLVLLSALALHWAWRRRLPPAARAMVAALLALGALHSLARYTPGGDVAQAAGALTAMERPGEAAVLTDPLLTEPFQEAYDGRLPLWGVARREEAGSQTAAAWLVGLAEPQPAQARFQIGAVRLDYSAQGGGLFPLERVPVTCTAGMEPGLCDPPEARGRLGDVMDLYATPLARAGAREVAPGTTVPIRLYWRALAPSDRPYTLFVQAVDGAGVKAGQVDRLPCDGACPTTSWQPGDLIGEWLHLPIAPEAPPGEYSVIAGMYDLANGKRLSAVDAQAATTGTYLVLGTLRVGR